MMRIERSYKYRIYPNKKQINLITKTFGCCRFVYNHFLHKSINDYNQNKTHYDFYEASKELTKLKNEYEWLKEPDKNALQNSLKDLKMAYKYFFNGRGFPKYKRKRTHSYSYRTSCTNNNISFCDGKIKLPKLGWVKTKNKQVPNGRIINATVSLSTLISQPVATQFFKDMVNNANIKETVVIDAGSLSGKDNIENVRNTIIENYKNNKKVVVECSNLQVMVVRGTNNARSDTFDSVKFDDVSYDESTQIIEMKTIVTKNFARYYVVTSIYPNIQVGTLVYMFSYNEIPTPDYRNGTYKLVATNDKFIPSYSWVSTSSDEDIMSRLESIEARLTALEG